MTLKESRDKIIKTEYAEEIYQKLRKVKDDEEYILGIMLSFKTDEDLKKLDELIDKGYNRPGDLLIDSMVLADVVKIAH